MKRTNYNLVQNFCLRDQHIQLNEQGIQKPKNQETSRESQMPSLAMSSNILSNLSSSISNYENNLRQFQSYIRSSVNKSQEIKGRCGLVLSTVLSQLKINFSQFAQEWKVQLPLICNQFMDLVGKICTLYQQQLEKLTQMNQKWQFSYHQLLRATNFSQSSTSSLESTCKLVSPRDSEIKQKQSRSLKVRVKDPEGQQTIISISDYLRKVKDPEISLMKEQITQLFEEEQSIQRDPMLSVAYKTINSQTLVRQEVKELRFRTLNDDLQKRNFEIHMEKAQSNQNYNSKTSQSNSRKSSLGGKDQFWQTLKNFIPNTKTTNLTSTKMSAGKQNMNISIKNKSTHCLEPPSGSKLQDLRRNMYKNKGQSQWG